MARDVRVTLERHTAFNLNRDILQNSVSGS
jgi:hypothetical protein